MNFPSFIRVLSADLQKAEALIQADKKLLELRSIRMKETALHYFAIEDKAEIVELLLKYAADVNARNASNETPLINAASLNYAAMVQLLLASGADISASDDLQDTALSRAVRNGSMKAARILVDAGADLDWRNDLGETLMDIVPRKHLATLKSLLESRAGS